MALTDILSGTASFAMSLLRPTAAIDVVAVLGPGFAPLFALARPLTATVFEDARLMEHPLEMGSVIADHIVIEPMEIELPCVITGELEYRATYAAIKTAFTTGTLLSVVTRTGVYSDMVITAMPHDERPQSFNAIEMSIRLRHAMFVQPQSTKMSASQTQNPAQASTVQRGSQQTTPTPAPRAAAAATGYENSGASAPQGSTLYQWFGQ